MRSLRICTALAVATAAVHIHSSDAKLFSEKRLRGEGDNAAAGDDTKVTELINIVGSTDNCLTEINNWRKKVNPGLKPYTALNDAEGGSGNEDGGGAEGEDDENGGSGAGGEDKENGGSGAEEGNENGDGGAEVPGTTDTETQGGGTETEETPESTTEEPTVPSARQVKAGENEANTSKADLADFLKDKTCGSLKAGTFSHISGAGNDAIFVVSASKTPAEGASMTCSDAISEFEKGFSAFEKKNPPAYKENDGVYKNPNAVGLISLTSEVSQKVFCGTPKECNDPNTIVCYFKPSFVKVDEVPIDTFTWHWVEERFGLKPAFKPQEENDKAYVDAVNAVRGKEGLALPAFTILKDLEENPPAKIRQEVEALTQIESALLDLTCDTLSTSAIDPATALGYTVIYALKEGSTPPTAKEAVEYWESGFEKLNYNLPPAFGVKETEGGDNAGGEGDKGEGGNKGEDNKGEENKGEEGNEDNKGEEGKGEEGKEEVGKEEEGKGEEVKGEEGGEEVEVKLNSRMARNSKTQSGNILGIYADSQVAGYVSLMTDKTRQMFCINATGCSKAGVVCVLKEATLVKNQQPISAGTWKKINTLKGVTKPTLTALATEKNCLMEINAIRTQDQIGFDAFVAAASPSKTLSPLMTSVTCQNLKAGKVKPTIGGSTSLMYFSAAEPTCEKAVIDWQSGVTSFADVETPPAYTADLALYKNKAASNFVSLMTDSKKQTATCYSAKGCEENAVVCELAPATLKEGVAPISAEKWKVITSVMKSGAPEVLSSVALLSSALLAFLAFTLQL